MEIDMGKNKPETNFLVQYRDNVTTRPGEFYLKTNDYYEIYTYIYGEGPYFYFVNDKTYNIEPDTVLLLRPGILIGSCKKIKARYTRLVCKLPAYTVDFIARLDPSLSEFLSKGDIGMIKLSGECREEYFSYVEELRVLSSEKNKENDIPMFSHILKMLSLLYKFYGKNNAERPSSASDELIVKITEKINREYSDISSVSELAERMNYSPNYISHYFNAHMNMKLHDYLLMKKLSVAATKLISGKSVTDTAFECGFGSTAYFISVFKERYGVTPGKYIEKNR